MTELLQRSRIERAQELDVVCVDTILRHERNGLTVGVEELRRHGTSQELDSQR